MERYDPEHGPDPRAWHATSEPERLRLIISYHVQSGEAQHEMRLHAAAHHAVEAWLAAGYRPALRALAALIRTGASRHSALHAIHTATAHLRAASGDQQAAINAALEQLARTR